MPDNVSVCMSFTHLHLLSQFYYVSGLVLVLKKLIVIRKIDKTTITILCDNC